MQIGVPGENTLDQVLLAVLTLLPAYYVFNINYPRQYAMIMALLQTYVLGEEYMGKRKKKPSSVQFVEPKSDSTTYGHGRRTRSNTMQSDNGMHI